MINQQNSPPHNPIEQSNTLRSILILVIFLVVGGFAYWGAGLRYPKGLSFGKAMKEDQQTVVGEAAPDSFKDVDLVFRKGFADTGLPWPPKEEDWSEELKQNPMCALRASYCSRVGHSYADFGCDCFVYQYYGEFETYKNTQEGFTVYYPKLWHITEHRPTEIIANQKLSLERDGAKCNLSYGLVDDVVILKTMNKYVSSSFVTVDGKELQKMTVDFTRKLTDEEHAAGYTDKKIIAIPHFPYENSEFGWLLTSYENQPIVEACEKELDSIAQSRMIDYGKITLNEDSAGEIFIQDIPIWYKTNESEEGGVSMLLFADSKTKEEHAIGPINGVFRIENPFVLGTTFYYMDQGQIKTFDMFSAQVNTVPLPYDDKKPIHSFFVEGDSMYYLSGTFCNEYMAQCNLNLDSFNLATNVRERLASNFSSREILGFNAKKDMLYTSYTMGDAGCMAITYEAYNFNSKKVSKVGEYSYCEGDDEIPDIYAKAVSGVATVDHIKVENGALSVPEKKFANMGDMIKMNLSKSVKTGGVDVNDITWQKVKFPENYYHLLEISYPEGWQFDCCADADDRSSHSISASKNSDLRIYITDFANMGCPVEVEECTLGEVINVDPKIIFDEKKKSITSYEPIKFYTMDAEGIKYREDSPEGAPSENYLLLTKRGVAKVRFMNPDEFGSQFIGDFLSRLRIAK